MIIDGLLLILGFILIEYLQYGVTQELLVFCFPFLIFIIKLTPTDFLVTSGHGELYLKPLK